MGYGNIFHSLRNLVIIRIRLMLALFLSSLSCDPSVINSIIFINSSLQCAPLHPRAIFHVQAECDEERNDRNILSKYKFGRKYI